jgi:hypothetical protein
MSSPLSGSGLVKATILSTKINGRRTVMTSTIFKKNKNFSGRNYKALKLSRFLNVMLFKTQD